MRTTLQIAIAVIVGYWLGHARPTDQTAMPAAPSDGRPTDVVDQVMKLLQSSPEFAALGESVRDQLLDAVRTAATTVLGAVGNSSPVSDGGDEARNTAPDGDTTDMAGDVGAAEGDMDEDSDTAADTTAPRDDAASAADVGSPDAPTPTSAEVRDWARGHGLSVSERGRLPAEVWEAYSAAIPTPTSAEVRNWARDHGLAVSDHGRLRAEVWDAYTTATHPEG
ncbi:MULTISPECIES: histone-like nucleoid-structuring protein Lsr2 [unclassified Rhodococcus (in: high G+C Gram-positive bacteria)]|uniref:Lsr2 family DNA-binding protein n=1 Tax=unclassified Rhodococcus (in: high G+C Gram-positive bacteria) TaxID=192944 RepID=UPI00163A1C81|nr:MULTISPECIES: histone-like nucleoid-structuring protein Lsr2 [unclassified Rhodococcus (in: high G+C Gram-positive bacteria)]MBC2641843.1 Lsr2 family protein [Rhodococcus sp. 3A]MBC2893414.1 Lsr2 family protein [Rhodococcus sp. 4CII]